MATISVYYVKGDIDQDLVTSVFADPAFSVVEVEFPPDQTDGDAKLKDILAQERTEGSGKTVVFLEKLAEKGKGQASEFASDVLANKDKLMVHQSSDFEAIGVPPGQIEKVFGDLERGGKIFDASPAVYDPYSSACVMVNRNVMIIFAFIILAVLLIVASKVDTAVGGFLMIAAILLLFFCVVAFSA